MSSKELTELINSLTGDIEFDYKGKHGAVCPFSLTDIAISFGSESHDHTSIEDVMHDRIFDGKCLEDIASELTLYNS